MNFIVAPFVRVRLRLGRTRRRRIDSPADGYIEERRYNAEGMVRVPISSRSCLAASVNGRRSYARGGR
jgi:hypothetical protein